MEEKKLTQKDLVNRIKEYLATEIYEGGYEILDHNLAAEDPTLGVQTAFRIIGIAVTPDGEVVAEYTMKKDAGTKAEFEAKVTAMKALRNFVSANYKVAENVKEDFVNSNIKLESDGMAVTLMADKKGKVSEQIVPLKPVKKVEPVQMTLDDFFRDETSSKESEPVKKTSKAPKKTVASEEEINVVQKVTKEKKKVTNETSKTTKENKEVNTEEKKVSKKIKEKESLSKERVEKDLHKSTGTNDKADVSERSYDKWYEGTKVKTIFNNMKIYTVVADLGNVIKIKDDTSGSYNVARSDLEIFVEEE